MNIKTCKVNTFSGIVLGVTDGILCQSVVLGRFIILYCVYEPINIINIKKQPFSGRKGCFSCFPRVTITLSVDFESVEFSRL